MYDDYNEIILTDSSDDFNPNNPFNKPYKKFYWQLEGLGKLPPEYKDCPKKKRKKWKLNELIYKKIPQNGISYHEYLGPNWLAHLGLGSVSPRRTGRFKSWCLVCCLSRNVVAALFLESAFVKLHQTAFFSVTWPSLPQFGNPKGTSWYQVLQAGTSL